MAHAQAIACDLSPRNDFLLLQEAAYDSYEKYKGYEHIVTAPAYQHGPEDRPVMGQVVAKGEDCRKITIPVGCIVLTGKWTGCRFTRHNTTYVLVKESDVLAVIE